MYRKLFLVACIAFLSACDSDSETGPSATVSPPPASPSSTSEVVTVEKRRAIKICPPQAASGAGVFAGSENGRIQTVYGQVAKLESVGPPFELTKTDLGVELSQVYYGGAVSGPYVVPSAGAIGQLMIDGKVLEFNNGDISTGCLDTKDLGQILILFDNSFMSKAVMVVMTEEQIRKLD